MAGQEERSFRTTPSYETPQVNPASSESTGGYRPTAATVQGNGAALQALGNVFGNFFGNTARQVEQVGDILNHAQMVQTERENKALAEQAGVDQKTGKTINPAYADRQAYYGAYQTSAADAHAFDMGQKLEAQMREMPMDGSVDPKAYAEDFYKKEIGTGTGDRDFDNRLLYTYAKQADAVVAHYNERVAQTVEQNTTKQILDNAANAMNSKEGMTTGSMADLFTRLNLVTRGDHAKTDKLVETMLASPRNDTQALATLNALEETGWAERNPVAYDRISQQALANTNKVKSWQAGKEVEDWRMKAMGLSANPNATMDDWAGLAAEAQRIDSRHGTGMEPFGALFAGMHKAASKQAGINLFEAAMNGVLGGSSDLGAYALRTGRSVPEVIDKDMDAYLAAVVQRPGASFENLRESTAQTGFVNPLASDDTASELARMLASPRIKDVSHAQMPGRLKQNLGSALTGTDQTMGSRAYRFYNELRGLVGDHDFSRYFPNQEAQAVYWGMKAIAPANGDMTQVFTAIRDNRLDAKTLSQASEHGEVNLGRIFGKDMKPDEIDAKVDKALAKGMLKDLNRAGWFSNPTVGLSTEDRANLTAMVAYQGLLLRKAGSLDLDTALDNAVKTFANTKLALPGQNGGIKIVDDPWGGKGRSADAPINGSPDSPISTLKGFYPVYSGFRMTNKLGETEDPLETWSHDSKTLSKKLPGVFPQVGLLSLGAPRSDGLMPILDSTSQPIQLHPGQEVAIRGAGNTPVWATGDAHSADNAPVGPDGIPLWALGGLGIRENTLTKGKIPEDPKVAAEFFKTHMPPGVFPVYSPSTHAYTLHYGFRMLGTAEARDSKIRARAAELERDRDARNKPLTPMEEGAAFLSIAM
ncbi:hypothetical protein [Ralstonia solanacearum]|uniref:hypothetical protein n=1 Tax=Ralstonia solanacearum TaxID=305 RepID=UPI0007D90A92|nr:hypothetical protein [Ralstonia solanacearum]